MASSSFYDDRKFCHDCDEYVPYLMSTEHSYCTHCGAQVKLFSKEDWGRFSEGLKPEKKNKGGRPRKQRETA
jgi:hypothetical protein